jgi:hypothetical protein
MAHDESPRRGSISIKQKISYEIYKAELDSICTKTKVIKTTLLKKARAYTILAVLINYPVKIILGTTVGGGAVQLLDENGRPWITILNTVIQVIALILVITRDFFEFETRIEKCYAAAAAIQSFYMNVKYESFLEKGKENDRFETLLMYNKIYEEIVSNNKIIQTVETTAGTPEELEAGIRRRDTDDDMDSASSVDDNAPTVRKTLEDKHRMLYIASILDRMPN